MAANTETLLEKILMELRQGGQRATIVELVYGGPKDDICSDSSTVRFEIEKKNFESEELISKSDFLSIAQEGKFMNFYDYCSVSAPSKEKVFPFKETDTSPPPLKRNYIGFISVPVNGKTNVTEMGYSTIVATRLPNHRLKIDWELHTHMEIPKELIIEFPRVQEYSKQSRDSRDNLVQTINDDDDLMYLGKYDENGDTFPIVDIERKGAVIIPLNPIHSSLIGIYYNLNPKENPDYIVVMPEPEPEPKSESESEPESESKS